MINPSPSESMAEWYLAVRKGAQPSCGTFTLTTIIIRITGTPLASHRCFSGLGSLAAVHIIVHPSLIPLHGHGIGSIHSTERHSASSNHFTARSSLPSG